MGTISTPDGSPVPNPFTQLFFDPDYLDPVTMVYDAGRKVIRAACRINEHTQRICNQIEPIIPDILKKKNALVLTANDDHNEAFSLSFLRNPLNLVVFYQIQHYYDVKYKKISDISDFCRAIDEHTKHYGPIDLLIIRAHGKQENIRLNRLDRFKIGDPLPTKSCLRNLPSRASIVLDSCSTGRGRESECNLANYLAAQSPKGVRILSAVDKTTGFIMSKVYPIEVAFCDLNQVKLNNLFKLENLTYKIDSKNLKAATSTIGLEVETEGLKTRGGWCRTQILERILIERDVFHDHIPHFGSRKSQDLKVGRLTFSTAMRTDGSMTAFTDLRSAVWGEETNPLASSLQALKTIQSHARREGAKSLYLQFYPPHADRGGLGNRSQRAGDFLHTTQRFQEIGRNKVFQTSRLNSYQRGQRATDSFSYGLGRYSKPSTADWGFEESDPFKYVGRSLRSSYGNQSTLPSHERYPTYKVKSYKESLKGTDPFSYNLTRRSNEYFAEGLQQNGLVGSYNMGKPGSEIADKGCYGRREIGGVGQNVGIIQGLFSHYNDFKEKQHFFYIPTTNGELSFSQDELSQIIREVAVCEYVDEALGFFCLGVNADHNLYPIPPPVLQDTLVGRSLALLDYYLKGFLNGTFFDEAFIDEWQETKSQDPDYLKANCISMHEYCLKHLGHSSYFSIRQSIDFTKKQEEEAQIASEEKEKESEGTHPRASAEPAIFSDHSGFRCSFRIIAKQKETIGKLGNMFSVDGDFDVLYRLLPDPAYEEELKKYRYQFKTDPPSYKRLVYVYEEMSRQIKTVMPQLPKFRKLFDMLKVVNFFSYYFRTLKQNQKIPFFESQPAHTNFAIPPLFPHLPIQTKQDQAVQINLLPIFQSLQTEDRKKVNEFLLNVPLNPFQVSREIYTILLPFVKKDFQAKCKVFLSDGGVPEQEYIRIIVCLLQALAPHYQKKAADAKQTLISVLAQTEFLREQQLNPSAPDGSRVARERIEIIIKNDQSSLAAQSAKIEVEQNSLSQLEKKFSDEEKKIEVAEGKDDPASQAALAAAKQALVAYKAEKERIEKCKLALEGSAVNLQKAIIDNTAIYQNVVNAEAFLMIPS